MAVEAQNPYAFMLEDCRCSSSQEELLANAEFARENEKFFDDGNSKKVQYFGVSNRKFDGKDEYWKGFGDDAELEEAGILGFRGEKLGETSGSKREGLSVEEREIEREVKRCKVSPMVDCGGKMVIEGDLKGSSGDRESRDCADKLGCESGGGGDVHIEGGDEEVVVGEDDMKKPEFTVENEVIVVEDSEEEGEAGEGRGGGEGGGMVKKPEFAVENEVIVVENGEEEGDGGDEGIGDGMREERRRRRELPRSMFGLVWYEGSESRDRVVRNQNEEEEEEKVVCDEGGEDANQNVEEEEVLCDEKNEDTTRNVEEKEEEEVCVEGSGNAIGNVEEEEEEEEEVLCGEGNEDATRNVEEKEEEEEEVCGEGSGDAIRDEVIGNDGVENGLEEASVGRNREGCKEGSMRIMLDVLRLLVEEKGINDGGNGKVDLIETAKRRGWTFPRSRFLPEEVEDDDDE